MSPTCRVSKHDQPAVLEIRKLHRAFGEHVVVEALDLTIAAGERVALLGANGAGKTTILRCVAGTLAPDSGEIKISAHPAGSPSARRLVGASLSQERSFYLRLSGHQNLLFFARLRVRGEKAARRAVQELTNELDLTDIIMERVDIYSSGMVQQLALARALLGEPKLLLLDEPTRSLDKAARRRLWGALKRRPTLSLLLSTHSDDDSAECGRLVHLPA